jgi:hypothetical protein
MIVKNEKLRMKNGGERSGCPCDSREIKDEK